MLKKAEGDRCEGGEILEGPTNLEAKEDKAQPRFFRFVNQGS